MNITVKILGHRNQVTKARKGDGADGYMKGSVGKPGQPTTVLGLNFHSRMDPKYKQYKEEFHR